MLCYVLNKNIKNVAWVERDIFRIFRSLLILNLVIFQEIKSSIYLHVFFKCRLLLQSYVVMRIIAFDTLSILKEQLKIQVWILQFLQFLIKHVWKEIIAMFIPSMNIFIKTAFADVFERRKCSGFADYCKYLKCTPFC